MARFAWSNRVVTLNDAIHSGEDAGPGLEAIADLSLDGTYKGTLRVRVLKAQDGLVDIDACEFLTFRPQPIVGGGGLARGLNVSQVVSDTTDWFGTPLPGATIAADFQVRPALNKAFVTQGTLTLTLVIKPGGLVATAFDFSGPFARVVAD